MAAAGGKVLVRICPTSAEEAAAVAVVVVEVDPAPARSDTGPWGWGAGDGDNCPGAPRKARTSSRTCRRPGGEAEGDSLPAAAVVGDAPGLAPVHASASRGRPCIVAGRRGTATVVLWACSRTPAETAVVVATRTAEYDVQTRADAHICLGCHLDCRHHARIAPAESRSSGIPAAPICRRGCGSFPPGNAARIRLVHAVIVAPSGGRTGKDSSAVTATAWRRPGEVKPRGDS